MRAGRGRGLHGVSEQSTKADSRKGRHNQNTRAHALQSARTPARKCARVRRMHTHKHTHTHKRTSKHQLRARRHTSHHTRAHTHRTCAPAMDTCTHAQARQAEAERVQRGSGP
jgi:hypothetical protein